MRTGAEIKVGLITLLAIGFLAIFIFYIRGYRTAVSTYNINVVFDNVMGLTRGDPVRVAGVQIGEVRSVSLVSPKGVQATLAIDRQYLLYSNFKFQIATAGIIQERFVEIIARPITPESHVLLEGETVSGSAAPGVADILSAGNKLLSNLNRISERLEKMLASEEVVGGFMRALTEFSEAANSATKLAQITYETAEKSQPTILATLQTLNLAATDIEATTGELRTRIQKGEIFANLESTLRETHAAAENAKRLSAMLSEIASDPEVREGIPTTLSALRDTSKSMRKVGKDLEVFSEEVRKASPTIPRIAGEAEQLTQTAKTLRERLSLPTIKGNFDTVYGAKEGRIFSRGSLDINTGAAKFLRIGIDDIGEENTVNVQLGEKLRRSTLRYGLVRSRLGLGFDVPLSRRASLSLDLFDPNNFRGDILADLPLIVGRSDLGLIAGMRDVGDANIFVAGVRLER